MRGKYHGKRGRHEELQHSVGRHRQGPQHQQVLQEQKQLVRIMLQKAREMRFFNCLFSDEDEMILRTVENQANDRQSALDDLTKITEIRIQEEVSKSSKSLFFSIELILYDINGIMNVS